MGLSNYKKARLILFCFLGFCLLLIGYYIYSSNQNHYGEQLEITNLNKYTSGKPSDIDTLNYIRSNLYRVVNLNTHPPVKNNSVKDVLVREGSFFQAYSATTHVYTVRFIVDIKSLKQSYSVSYEWVGDIKYASNKKEYGTQVSCLAIDELVYGDFGCVDDRIIEKGKQYYDPVEKVLPRTVQYKYTIKTYMVVVTGSKITLNVEAFVPSWGDKQSTLDGYSKEIKDWLASKKLNPDHYDLEYTY